MLRAHEKEQSTPQTRCLGLISPQIQNAVCKGWKGRGFGDWREHPKDQCGDICGLITVNTHLLLYVPTLCLAWQQLNLNSFFWLQQFSSPICHSQPSNRSLPAGAQAAEDMCAGSFRYTSLAKKLLSPVSCLINRTLKWTQIPPSLIPLGWWGKSSHRGTEETWTWLCL